MTFPDLAVSSFHVVSLMMRPAWQACLPVPWQEPTLMDDGVILRGVAGLVSQYGVARNLWDA